MAYREYNHHWKYITGCLLDIFRASNATQLCGDKGLINMGNLELEPVYNWSCKGQWKQTYGLLTRYMSGINIL